ncbi:MAG: hypothetical protein PHT76_11485 [Anaerostipes sp.]|nr:hypothetical protein [Anaerostipes sp.]
MATEVAQAYVQIIPSAKGIKGKLTQSFGGEASTAGDSAGKTFGAKMAIGAGVAFAAAGIGKVVASSIGKGAALEQSIGGIETLFKGSADKVKQYASEAYKTSGVSANAYMENVTSFSASLLKSLGGDTSKAADVANTAMIDMSDNSNKMGTSMESIQDAYQGFAKQNYTMLDNLKLGYGGTKTEMQRLLADATKLTGQKYDINNLSDVYQAIHAVQGELGITGTTAKESASTLSGSFASVKAAGEDLLGNMALGKDITPQLSNLGATITTFVGGNLLPAIGNVFSTFPQIIATAFTGITAAMPQMTAVGVELMNGLATSIQSSLPVMIPAAMNAIMGFSETLRSSAGSLVDAGLNMIMSIADGIIANIPTFITTVPQIITNIAGIINDNAPKLLVCGVTLIAKLAIGIVKSIPTLVANIPKIFVAIASVFTAMNWVSLGKTAITTIKKGIDALKTQVPNTLKSIGSKAVSAFKGISWSNVGSTIIKFIANGVKSLMTFIPNTLKSIGTKAVSAFKNINWASVGKNIIKGIAGGVSGAAGALLDAARNAASNALSAIKKKLGIHSPSRVFRDEVGKMMALGMAEGFESNVPRLDFNNSLGVMTKGVPVNDMRNNQQVTDSILGLAPAFARSVAEALDGMEFKANDREIGRMVRRYV